MCTHMVHEILRKTLLTEAPIKYPDQVTFSKVQNIIGAVQKKTYKCS